MSASHLRRRGVVLHHSTLHPPGAHPCLTMDATAWRFASSVALKPVVLSFSPPVPRSSYVCQVAVWLPGHTLALVRPCPSIRCSSDVLPATSVAATTHAHGLPARLTPPHAAHRVAPPQSDDDEQVDAGRECQWTGEPRGRGRVWLDGRRVVTIPTNRRRCAHDDRCRAGRCATH